VKRVALKDWWNTRKQSVLLDVRTPAEFEKGHIPGALNLPLFSNDERAEVGTIYKQEGPEPALLRGLELVGPKMRGFVERARDLVPDRKLTVHCWRGGNRSASMAWLLDLAGFEVEILEGGYKAFRKFVLDGFFKKKLNLTVLGGKTGTGKTSILHALREKGEQVIDLEGLANHKGSAFGWIGEDPQPTSEHFENRLFDVFSSLESEKPTWIENESRTVGKVYIPQGMWDQMKAAPLVNIEFPLEERIRHLVDTYTQTEAEDLKVCFRNLKKRLGGQNVKAGLEALERNDYATAVKIALTYYDKTYQYQLDNSPAPEVHMLSFDQLNPEVIAKTLIRFRSDGVME
jgi:tRNA 2-selenouridine synthase